MMNRERKRCKTLTVYTSKVFTYRAPYESRTSNRTSKVLNWRRHLASLLVACAKGLATNELPPNHRDCAVVAKMEPSLTFKEWKCKHLAPFIVSIVFLPKAHTMCAPLVRWDYDLRGNGMNANSISRTAVQNAPRYPVHQTMPTLGLWIEDCSCRIV